ncbi:putative diguanylate cyclase DgcT [bioreactor metagenome]|uniref:Putative diguanylate cyclase DgcT n=1 Tax=bioreactor metagenome TaxID=1076179 RepID=A0A645HX48_9ZZZZ
MADIDFFKVVNDTYGHLIGDKVIRDIAKLIQASIRKDQDWVGRYGGEEFLITLNNTDVKDAFIVCEKIRKIIENTTFEYEEAKVKVTASFGVYGIVSTKLDIEGFINAADKSLYAAKVTGRNKTVISENI